MLEEITDLLISPTLVKRLRKMRPHLYYDRLKKFGHVRFKWEGFDWDKNEVIWK
ncbi:hypothetical protein ACFL0V_05430 [Nanoarchaeota archaeon]